MANYKKTSGGAAVGIVALVLAFALVIVYVAVSLFKDSFNPLDWTSQIQYDGELNINTGEKPGEDTTDPDDLGEEDSSSEKPTDPDEPAEPDTPEDVFFTIDDKTATDGNFITGNTYTLEGNFCMTEVMPAILYVFQNNYVPFKVAADEFFTTGVPLCVITFENSDIYYGILVDVTDFATNIRG